MVGDEESKFYLADRNGDTKLDVAEYAAFLHPQNYDHMHDLEIDNALVDYDKNRDGFVSFAEYLGECTYTIHIFSMFAKHDVVILPNELSLYCYYYYYYYY